MDNALTIIRWLLAVILILTGIKSVDAYQNYIGGPIAIFCGLFMLPPITAAISRRTAIGPWAPWLALIFGLIAALATQPSVVRTKVKIKAAERRSPRKVLGLTS